MNIASFQTLWIKFLIRISCASTRTVKKCTGGLPANNVSEVFSRVPPAALTYNRQTNRPRTEPTDLSKLMLTSAGIFGPRGRAAGQKGSYLRSSKTEWTFLGNGGVSEAQNVPIWINRPDIRANVNSISSTIKMCSVRKSHKHKD